MFGRIGLMIVALWLTAGCTTFAASTDGVVTHVDDAAVEAGDTSALLGAVFDPPRALSDFSLMSTTGAPFTLSDHRGEAILLYFGYRSCPDFCPTTFADMRRVYRDLGEPVTERLNVVFVTLDPARDTLDIMTQYVASFHPDFIGLRDEGAGLAALMADFGVVSEQRIVGESSLSYLIDHTASVFLIGTDGRLVAQYLYGTDYRDIVHDVGVLLQG